MARMARRSWSVRAPDQNARRTPMNPRAIRADVRPSRCTTTSTIEHEDRLTQTAHLAAAQPLAVGTKRRVQGVLCCFPLLHRCDQLLRDFRPSQSDVEARVEQTQLNLPELNVPLRLLRAQPGLLLDGG